MDVPQVLLIAGHAAAFVLIGVMTWAACRWWYGRKLQAAACRLYKIDQSRLFANQQTMQARAQIETLKKELVARQAVAAMPPAVQHRPRPMVVAEVPPAERKPEGAGTSLPASFGFADTQLIA